MDIPAFRCIVDKSRRIGEAEVPGPWATDLDDADGGFYFGTFDDASITGEEELAAVIAAVAQDS